MIVYCMIAPPEPPDPMVWVTGPYDSISRSLVIIAASAASTGLQLVSLTRRLFDATA